MKHLLFLLDYYPPHRWGVENVFENVISRLLKKSYHITLITSRFDPHLPKEEKQGSLRIHRVGRGRKSFFFKSFRKGVQVLSQHPEIEVIHSSTYTSAIPASLLGTFFKKRRILTIHEIFWALWRVFKPRYARWMYQLFEWLMFVFPQEGYHCVSLYTLNSVRLRYGLPDRKLHLIHNGVDTEFWNVDAVSEKVKKKWRKKVWGGGKFLMLYYGHSWVSKGIDYLVEAIPEILKKNEDGVLIFNLIPAKRDREVKKRILVAQTPARCTRTPLSGGSTVCIFDWREKEELRELVASVDVVIAPSLTEGFGSVHSEACGMGKVLITTQVAAIPEVVSGKVKFVQPCSADAIVQGIEAVRKGKVEMIPEKAFSRDESVEKIEELYSA